MALGCLRFLAVRPWKSLQWIWNIAFRNLWYKMLEYDKYLLVGVSLLLFLGPRTLLHKKGSGTPHINALTHEKEKGKRRKTRQTNVVLFIT